MPRVASIVLSLLTLFVAFVPVRANAAAPAHATVTAALNQSALQAGGKATVAIVVDIADGFHAQSHTPSEEFYKPFQAALDPAPFLVAHEPIYPPGKNESYKDLGVLNVYTGRVIVYVPVEVKAAAPPGAITLSGRVQLQACDDRVCYRPETHPFALSTSIVAAGEPVTPTNTELFGVSVAPAVAFDFFGLDVSNSYLLAFSAAFVIGIIFNVMPCVLPVVPLKAMSFYEVSQHNRAKSIALGTVFSAGIIASFAVLGLLVIALHWLQWGELFTRVWFRATIVVVLLLMALGTFGFFTVAVPRAVYNVTPRHDTYVGNFLFGVLTAALSTPCTFGLFVGLLTWALAQPPVVGTLLMVMVGVGMASPYFVLSALPGLARRFPRTGPWAEVVKQLMGFLLLGTAAYFAEPFIKGLMGASGFWWSLFAIVAAAGIFLVVRSFQLSRTLLPKVIAVAVAILLVGPSLFAARMLTAKPYAWQPYSEQALSDGLAQNKVVLVEFTASWCGNCHALEAFVLNSYRVVSTVKKNGVVMLKADVTDENAAARPLLNQLSPAGAIPFTAIYSPHLPEPIRLTGIYRKKDLTQAIELAARPNVALQ